MLSRVAVLSGLESYMAGREERAGQIGIHVLSRVPDYSAADIRLDPAEEAVLGLGRCAKARELPETATAAEQTLGWRGDSRGSPKRLPPLDAPDLRAAPAETRARPTWLDAVQLHSLATPAVNGALAPPPADDSLGPPRPASVSASPSGAVVAPFAPFSPSAGDISAISCRYLGGFGETNGFDPPNKRIVRQQSPEAAGASRRRVAVHGYRYRASSLSLSLSVCVFVCVCVCMCARACVCVCVCDSDDSDSLCVTQAAEDLPRAAGGAA